MPCRKLKQLFLSTIGILIVGLIVFTSCVRTTHVPVPYIPPNYLDCIEVSTLQLANFYFSHYTASIADEVFKGKAIIIKNVKLTEEIMNSKTKTHINIGGWVLIEPQNPSDLKRISVGDVVDIVGECAGRSEEWVAVVVKNCLIQPAGLLPLPMPGGEESDIDYDY